MINIEADGDMLLKIMKQIEFSSATLSIVSFKVIELSVNPSISFSYHLSQPQKNRQIKSDKRRQAISVTLTYHSMYPINF